MYVNAEKHIFEILPHSLFYCRQYRQYIWADFGGLALLFGLPSKRLCGRISKMCFSALAYIPNHRLRLLLSCTFHMLKSSFSWCVSRKSPNWPFFPTITKYHQNLPKLRFFAKNCPDFTFCQSKWRNRTKPKYHINRTSVSESVTAYHDDLAAWWKNHLDD